ncbi:MAG: helix-turn-helix transcriptional regulator [Cyclobacteriaceae bacterium]
MTNKLDGDNLRNDQLKPIVQELDRLLEVKNESLPDDKKMTQEELEAHLGYSYGMISRWKKGLRTPSFYSLNCWLHALDAKLVVVSKNSNDR